MIIRNTNQRGNIYYIVDHPPGKFCYGEGMFCYVVKISPGDNLLYSGISGEGLLYSRSSRGMFCYIVDNPGGRSARGKVHYMTPDHGCMENHTNHGKVTDDKNISVICLSCIFQSKE